MRLPAPGAGPDSFGAGHAAHRDWLLIGRQRPPAITNLAPLIRAAADAKEPKFLLLGNGLSDGGRLLLESLHLLGGLCFMCASRQTGVIGTRPGR